MYVYIFDVYVKRCTYTYTYTHIYIYINISIYIYIHIHLYLVPMMVTGRRLLPGAQCLSICTVAPVCCCCNMQHIFFIFFGMICLSIYFFSLYAYR